MGDRKPSVGSDDGTKTPQMTPSPSRTPSAPPIQGAATPDPTPSPGPPPAYERGDGTPGPTPTPGPPPAYEKAASTSGPTPSPGPPAAYGRGSEMPGPTPTPGPPPAYEKGNGMLVDGAMSGPPLHSQGSGATMMDEAPVASYIQPVPYPPTSTATVTEASHAQTVVQNHFVVADFWPSCLQRGIQLRNQLPVFQPFSFVMQYANAYLLQNPHLRVYRCETLERSTDFKGRFSTTANADLEPAFGWRIFVRGLRLWCIDSPETVPQQLWYLNLMPEIAKFDQLGAPSGFEGITRTMDRLNAYMVTNPLPGTVITIDTLTLRLTSSLTGPVNLDRSCRGAPADANQSFLMCFRIFYALGPPAGECVGVVKFAPEGFVRGGKAHWSEQDLMMIQASSWALNPTRRVTNFQNFRTPVNIDLTSGPVRPIEVPMDETKLVMLNNSSIVFCLMAGFTFRADGRPTRSVFPSGTFSTRTFLPVKVGEKSYETVQETLLRVSAYLHYSRSKVVFAETIPIPHLPQNNVIHEEKVHYEMAKGKGNHWIHIFRLYFDGPSADVNLSLLPHPSKPSSQVCTIL